jgi:tRNA-splicing ligase RtcB (3'-phosphate/5'-hydroxy nucleic acid ligase)
MSLSRIRGQQVDVHLWVPAHEVESGALAQLRNIAALPWVFHHVAAMADVHYGKGATVGSVIAMEGAVSPAAVGVDIGCGMGAARTSLSAEDLPESLRALRQDIEAAIPVGFADHGGRESEASRDRALAAERERLFAAFEDLDPEVHRLRGKALGQVGTLGGGNHFIEVCLDTSGAVWLMLHSGSRNIGKTLAEIHIGRARKLAHNRDLPDRDLAVFLAGTPEMEAYRHDLFWAQRYALLNRRAMFTILQAVVLRHFPQARFEDPVLCHHNYVAEEVHYGREVLVTRKGAIRAGRGELGIIPGSMGTRSFVVRGLGNEESFQSASHGAGRRMSRGEAKRSFDARDLEVQTAGVECRKDRGVIDEIPGAYKDIDRVMEQQRELVEVVAELKQVLCVKG